MAHCHAAAGRRGAGGGLQWGMMQAAGLRSCCIFKSSSNFQKRTTHSQSIPTRLLEDNGSLCLMFVPLPSHYCLKVRYIVRIDTITSQHYERHACSCCSRCKIESNRPQIARICLITAGRQQRGGAAVQSAWENLARGAVALFCYTGLLFDVGVKLQRLTRPGAPLPACGLS
jgi:hypothetical protein